MSKKDFLIAVLQKLKEDWPPAQGLLIMVTYNLFGEQTVDKISDIIAESIKHTEDQLIKEKLSLAHASLERLQELEAEQKAIDEEEAEALLAKM
jgi:hypothetical protein